MNLIVSGLETITIMAGNMEAAGGQGVGATAFVSPFPVTYFLYTCPKIAFNWGPNIPMRTYEIISFKSSQALFPFPPSGPNERHLAFQASQTAVLSGFSDLNSFIFLHDYA